MASEKKKRKLKNSFCVSSALKNKLPYKCKRLLFYTSSQRKQEKQEIKENALLKLKLEVLEDETPWEDIKDKSELIKENTELKEKLENLQKYLDTQNCYRECAETWVKFIKARNLLKRYMKIYVNPYPEEEIELRNEAEQFLNSEAEK